MVAKILRIVDTVLTFVALVLGCVALSGVSDNKDTIKATYWMKANAGGLGLDVDLYGNLWGYYVDVDFDVDGNPAEWDDNSDPKDVKDAMFALVVLGFVVTVIKLIVAIVGIIVPPNNMGVGIGSILLSLLGLAFWFAAVGLWTNKALDGDDKIKDYDDFENGPGFATAAVCGALAVLSLLISIGALVLGGKEGGAPEAVDSKNKDVEMANAK